MPRFPASAWLLAALAAGLASCDRGAEETLEAIPELPFVEAPLAPDTVLLVSGAGDTLRFRISRAEDGTRLARYRRVSVS